MTESDRIWAIFGKYYPNFSGSAIQGHQIMRELARQGFRFQVLTAANHKAQSLAGRQIEKDGLSIRYLPVIKYYHRPMPFPFLEKPFRLINTILSNLSFNIKIAWVLWREGNKGDVVHFHSFNETTFLVSWFAQTLGMYPVLLLTLMGSDDPYSVDQNGTPLLKRFKLKAFSSTEAVITLCTAQTESCRLAGMKMEKVVQIPCAVDTTKFEPLSDVTTQQQLRKELGLCPDRRYILFAGSATLRKGIDVLISAFTHIAHTIEDVDLLIVGPSDFRDYTRYSPALLESVKRLKNEIDKNGLGQRVHWFGRVDNVYHYLQAADIFCLPTRREGFGIVIAEAMATGLPAVVARLPGVTTDHLSSENEGILISGHDASDYSEALLWLLEHPLQARRIGKQARARAMSVFSMDDVVLPKFVQLYREVSEETSHQRNLRHGADSVDHSGSQWKVS